MSEYWVSTKKYWCKHCQTFVKDTPVSKQQHDATPKHQGALKRFLRDLHRGKERDATAVENARKEAERLNKTFSAAGPSSSSSTAADTSVKPVIPPVGGLRSTTRGGGSGGGVKATEEQRAKQMSQLAALGVAMPVEYKKENAMAGEWEVTRVIEPVLPPDLDNEGETKTKMEEVNGEMRGEVAEDDGEEEGHGRGFKIRTRRWPAGEDDGALVGLPEIGKGVFAKRKRAPVAGPNDLVKKEVVDEILPGVNGAVASEDVVKAEVVKTEQGETAVKAEPEAVVFKKRKVRNSRT